MPLTGGEKPTQIKRLPREVPAYDSFGCLRLYVRGANPRQVIAPLAGSPSGHPLMVQTESCIVHEVLIRT